MKKDDSLKCISYLSDVIGWLESVWQRPHIHLQEVILRELQEVQETIRQAYEAEQPENAYKAMEAALLLLNANIMNMRTELLVIKAEVTKESPGEP